MNPALDTAICLFGAGGHGKVVASQMRRSGYTDLCFADGGNTKGTLVGDIPVSYSALDEISDRKLILTIGNNNARAKLQREAEQRGLDFVSYIADPDTYYTAQPPGASSMILRGVIVNCDVRIGKGVIVNTGAVVEHDVEVGDYCHISPGAVIAGGSRIGAGCWIGAGATIIQEIRVVGGAIIGAGAVVIRDIDEPGTYVGNPVKKIK